MRFRTDLQGSRFGRYVLGEVLGMGGMGIVYDAKDEKGNEVAVKLMAPELTRDEEFRKRFIREAHLPLQHDNIVRVLEAGETEEGQLFLVMPLVRGVDLKRLIAGRPLHHRRAVGLTAQAAAALDAAHEAGIVHRDVKPQNMLVESTELGEDHLYLLDFGLIKTASASRSITAGLFVGSTHYLAPEQIEGKPVDGRADVYALGCVLAECLTGRVPFERETEVAVLWAHVRDDPPAPSRIHNQLPSAIDQVIAKAMAKDPQDRFLTAGELAEAAAAAFDMSGVGRQLWAGPPLVRPKPEAAPVEKPEPSRAGAGFAAGIAAALLILGGVAMTRGGVPPQVSGDGAPAATGDPSAGQTLRLDAGDGSDGDARGDKTKREDGAGGKKNPGNSSLVPSGSGDARAGSGDGPAADSPSGGNNGGDPAVPRVSDPDDDVPTPSAVQAAAPISVGEYEYATSGWTSVGPDRRNLPQSTTLTVGRPAASGLQRQTRDLRDSQGNGMVIDSQLIYRRTGVYLSKVEVTTYGTGGFGAQQEYELSTPSLLVATGAGPGFTQSFSMVDGETRVGVSITAQRWETLTIGGSSIRALVVRTDMSLSGDIEGDRRETVWLWPKHHLVLKERVRADMMSGPLRVQANYSSVLRELTASDPDGSP